MIILNPKKCQNPIGINPKEVSSFQLKKNSVVFPKEENPKEAILISIIMKDGEKYNVFYRFDNKESRDMYFSALKEEDGSRLPKSSTWGIFEEIIKILNDTQRI